MKVIIAGSRNFNDYSKLCDVCDFMFQKQSVIEIISGTARGGDKLGERYAEERNYNIIKIPADWDRYGKSAGYIRNEEMAKIGEGLIAFWDGKSRGTKHMIDLAKKYNLKIKIIYF